MSEEVEQARKELELLNSLPEEIQPLLELARRSLQATIDQRPIRVLNWRRLVVMMIAERPKVIYATMKEDKAVCRCIYKDGEYQDPVMVASSWDTPMISFDYREPEECFIEVESRTSVLNCPTWPLILITRLKSAGIKMLPMR
ncbi:hypothetical protein M8623_003369 [Salmonella enterica subsp. enterica]|nr:hypothetical protein [Salmonella enterica subsp. enterica]